MTRTALLLSLLFTQTCLEDRNTIQNKPISSPSTQLSCKNEDKGLGLIGGNIIHHNHDTNPETILLTFSDKGHHISHCTGVFIEQRLILTAAHCFYDHNNNQKTLVGGGLKDLDDNHCKKIVEGKNTFTGCKDSLSLMPDPTLPTEFLILANKHQSDFSNKMPLPCKINNQIHSKSCLSLSTTTDDFYSYRFNQNHIKSAFIHPEYEKKLATDERLSYDIAAVILKSGRTNYISDTKPNAFAQLITRKSKISETVSIIGYGLTGLNNTVIDYQKRIGQNTLIPVAIKDNHYVFDTEVSSQKKTTLARTKIPLSFITIANLEEPKQGTVSIAQGDSGGPLFVDGKLAAITSHYSTTTIPATPKPFAFYLGNFLDLSCPHIKSFISTIQKKESISPLYQDQFSASNEIDCLTGKPVSSSTTSSNNLVQVQSSNAIPRLSITGCQ